MPDRDTLGEESRLHEVEDELLDQLRDDPELPLDEDDCCCCCGGGGCTKPDTRYCPGASPMRW